MLDKIRLQNNFSSSIEIHNEKSFLEPSLENRLKHLPTHKQFEKYVEYNLVLILKPFLRHEKIIKFIDPFIRNKKATNNLKKLLTIIDENASITIKTLPESEIKLEDNYKIKNFNDVINARKCVKVEYYTLKEIKKLNSESYNVLGHKERYIITNRFKIYIPGGLDQFDDGIPNLTDASDIMELHIDKLTNSF